MAADLISWHSPPYSTSVAQELQKEVAEFRLPDLEAEYTEEEGERLDEALERYGVV